MGLWTSQGYAPLRRRLLVTACWAPLVLCAACSGTVHDVGRLTDGAPDGRSKSSGDNSPSNDAGSVDGSSAGGRVTDHHSDPNGLSAGCPSVPFRYDGPRQFDRVNGCDHEVLELKVQTT